MLESEVQGETQTKQDQSKENENKLRHLITDTALVNEIITKLNNTTTKTFELHCNSFNKYGIEALQCVFQMLAATNKTHLVLKIPLSHYKYEQLQEAFAVLNNSTVSSLDIDDNGSLSISENVMSALISTLKNLYTLNINNTKTSHQTSMSLATILRGTQHTSIQHVGLAGNALSTLSNPAHNLSHAVQEFKNSNVCSINFRNNNFFLFEPSLYQKIIKNLALAGITSLELDIVDVINPSVCTFEQLETAFNDAKIPALTLHDDYSNKFIDFNSLADKIKKLKKIFVSLVLNFRKEKLNCSANQGLTPLLTALKNVGIYALALAIDDITNPKDLEFKRLKEAIKNTKIVSLIVFCAEDAVNTINFNRCAKRISALKETLVFFELDLQNYDKPIESDFINKIISDFKKSIQSFGLHMHRDYPLSLQSIINLINVLQRNNVNSLQISPLDEERMIHTDKYSELMDKLNQTQFQCTITPYHEGAAGGDSISIQINRPNTATLLHTTTVKNSEYNDSRNRIPELIKGFFSKNKSISLTDNKSTSQTAKNPVLTLGN